MNTALNTMRWSFARLALTALAAMLASVVACADYGDQWVPKRSGVAVFDGPDRGFPVVAYIGPGHRVRQESNTKIRGFLKISLPHAGGVHGYVMERELAFVGAPRDDGAARAIADRRRLAAEIAAAVRPQPAGLAWSALLFLLLASSLAAAFAWFVRRRGILQRRSPAATSPAMLDPGVASALPAAGNRPATGQAMWVKAMTLAGGDERRAAGLLRELTRERRDRTRSAAAGAADDTKRPAEATRSAAGPTFPRLLLASSLSLPALLLLLILPHLTLFAIPPVAAAPAGLTLVTWRSGTGRRVDSPEAICARRGRQTEDACRDVVLAVLTNEARVVARLPYSESLFARSLRD